MAKIGSLRQEAFSGQEWIINTGGVRWILIPVDYLAVLPATALFTIYTHAGTSSTFQLLFSCTIHTETETKYSLFEDYLVQIMKENLFLGSYEAHLLSSIF